MSDNMYNKLMVADGSMSVFVVLCQVLLHY